MAAFSIWPQAEYRFQDFLALKASHESVESFFTHLYPNVFPVLFSSARAGLTAVLQNAGVTRNDHIFIPPYASHCVLNAATLLGTSTPFLTNSQVKVFLIVHQWGIPFYFKAEEALIIEDSVDSMIINQSSLFPNDGAYELISLPKIIGSVAGGIVLCQNKNHAIALKKIRDRRKNFKLISFVLRTNLIEQAYLKNYWSLMDIHGGRLPFLALNEIEKRLESWSVISEFKQNKMKLHNHYLTASGYKTQENRLLACIPISNQDKFKKAVLAPITRHILEEQQMNPGLNLKQVLAMPLHLQTDFAKLEELIH